MRKWVSRAWLILAGFALALLVGVIASAGTAATKTKIGGARCMAATAGGVICWWPNRPYSVAVSRQLVVVWKGEMKVFVRSNRLTTDCIPLAGGGRICPP